MDALNHLDKDNVMLLNVNYHQPSHDTDWKDYLDVIYKNLKTGNKHVITIPEPEIDLYIAKPEHRNYDYNKTYIELDKVDKYTAKYNKLPWFIAETIDPEKLIPYINNAIKMKNRSQIKNLHHHQYVFGSDYEIENWYRIWWFLNMQNDKEKPLTKQYLDIEVDGIDYPGFPKAGECPINAVTIVDDEDMAAFTFLLRNPNNPLIQEFEDEIDEFIEELHEDFDETYGDLDYRIYMYDEEEELIKDMFKLIHTLKRDFILIWNAGFDIPYIIARCEELGLDPLNLFCHPDFVQKQMFYYKDKRNFDVANKGDYFKASSYTTWLDQMLIYAGLRKGQGEVRSYKLNYVGQKEVGDEKLDYAEEANIKTLPYVNYKKFVKYNIKDVLLQMGIEKKTDDVSNIYQRASANATSYQKIFKQTVFLKNRAYIEYYNQGLIIGNNTNIVHGTQRGEGEEDKKRETLFDGALVADPTLNSHTGVELYDKPSKYIYDDTIDMDFSSMYPFIIISFNIIASTMVGKLLIDSEYQKVAQAAINGKIDEPGKDFMDNLLVGNPLNMGSKWFNLPDTKELHQMLLEHFDIKEKKTFILDTSNLEKFDEELVIDIKL